MVATECKPFAGQHLLGFGHITADDGVVHCPDLVHIGGHQVQEVLHLTHGRLLADESVSLTGDHQVLQAKQIRLLQPLLDQVVQTICFWIFLFLL